VKYFGDIRIENTDMSNDKGYEKYPRCKPKGFYGRLIHVELDGP